jgi:hypothetical protein
MGYIECLINCKPSLVKNFFGFVFDASYDGTVLTDMGIKVLSHISDHSCVVLFKHRAAWPMVSRDFVCLVTAKEGVVEEREKTQEEKKEPPRASFVQSAKRRMSGIIFDKKKLSMRRGTKLVKNMASEGGKGGEGGEEVRAKAKELELLVVNVSSIDSSEYEKFGAPVDVNFTRGSVQCDFIVRGVKLEKRVNNMKERSASTRSARSSSTVRASDGKEDYERLTEALEDRSMGNMRQNTAKTNALMKNSERKLRSLQKGSLRDVQTIPDEKYEEEEEEDSGDASATLKMRKEKVSRSKQIDDEAKTTLVSFLGSVDAKGQLSRIYVDGEAKKLSMAFQKIKDDLELTTLTAMGRTYNERINEMNRRLAYKWNQENLMEKCCVIIAALVYMFEEYMVFGVNLAIDGCRVMYGRIGLAVALVLISDFVADFLLTKYAMQFCEVDMTARLTRRDNKVNLVFCIFFIVTTYITAATVAAAQAGG